MKFRVLGPMEVSDGDRLVDIGSRMPRAVLAVLLLEANRVVSLDQIIDRLWGDDPPAKATSVLQVYVSNLRRALEPARPPRASPQVLVTRSPGYLLRVEDDGFDAARFEALAAEGRELLAAGRPSGARDTLRCGLALWRGEPYADLAFEAFLQPEIARLNELRAGAGEALMEAELALGEHAAVVAELDRMVAIDPLRERRWELLALALYRCGRQAEAIRAVERARRTLGEELGIELGPALRQLESEILRQSPALDWQPPSTGVGERPLEVTAPGPSGPAADEGTLVGRDRELSLLLEVLGRGLRGRGQVVLLAGEPGIGKTRLAEELAARAAEQGACVAWGRCHDGEGAPAFWPWMQVVRMLNDHLDLEDLRAALGPGAAEVSQIVPELKERLSDLRPVDTFDLAEARARLYDALSRFLLRVAAGEPLVVILDDLHWADLPSVQLFSFFACQLETVPVIVVGTYRDGEVGDSLTTAITTLAREANVFHLTLGGLEKGDVARLLTLPSGAAPSDELLAAVWDRTEGNPFFVGELLRLLEIQGGLGDEVPGRVRDVIRRRLALLPEESSRMLSVASVLGQDFDLGVVALVGDYDLEAALEIVEAALVARLVLEVPDAVGRYRFSHTLVRQTLYHELSALRRARLHHRVAESLEAGGAVDPVELAHHYCQAAAVVGGAHAALAWAERAAEEALSRLAWEQAEELLNRALQLLERLPAGRERDRRELDVQGRLHQLLLMTRGRGAPELGRVATRAVELGRKLDNAQQLGPALYRLASFHASWGEIAVAFEVAEELLALGKSSRDPVIHFLGLAANGYGELYRGRLREARSYIEQAMALGDVLYDDSLLPVFGQYPAVGCWGYLAIVLGLMGDEDRAKELTARALVLAERLGHSFSLAIALHYDAWLGVIRRDVPHVYRRAAETVSACQKGGFRMWRAAAEIMLSWARAHEGAPEVEAASIARSLTEYRATGARRYQHIFFGLLGEVRLLESRPEAALSALDMGLTEARGTGERFYEAELHRLRGKALAMLSPERAAEAESSLRRAVAVARTQGAVLLEQRAAVSLGTFLRRRGLATETLTGAE